MNEIIAAKLREKFGDKVLSVNEYRGELTVVVAKRSIVDVAAFLRDDAELTFDSIRDVCGADYYRPDDRYEVVYNVYSMKNNFRVRIKVRVDEKDLKVATVSGVWPGANWMEREAYDMYGIVFEGHPDPRRMYMPEDFEYFPLRKDFPLMGIPGSLTLPRK